MSSLPVPIPLDADESPHLCVLVDIEEEFDWERPFDRSARGAGHVGQLARLDAVLAPRGVVPAGVVTYPVAEDERAAALLAELADTGRLEVGSHLHPWVNPPDEELVCPRNSFPGNLPPALEAAKLERLTEIVTERLGVPPRVYQAGRYGLGPRTLATLHELGYTVDMSVSPAFDYGPDGPDYTHSDTGPCWAGADTLLGLPVTGAIVGWAGPLALPLYRLGRSLGTLRATAVLARCRLAERLRLSPEGHRPADLKRLTRALLDRGDRVFTLSLHSPSLEPGHTAYAPDEAARDALLDRVAGYVDWFAETLGGRFTTPTRLRAELLARQPAPPAAASARSAGSAT